MENWYQVSDVREVNSPALLIYPDRISYNIRLLKSYVRDNTDRLRPHVKTHKMEKICEMMLNEGITQFKCSTIAEAEMLAKAGAGDVIWAYQPVGPNVQRWIDLMQAYPHLSFSCLVDNIETIRTLGQIAQAKNLSLAIYIDLNVGMDRTGVAPQGLPDLLSEIKKQEFLRLKGVHGYDGHIHAKDIEIRQAQSDDSYAILKQAFDFSQAQYAYPLRMVIGGSPSFSSHAKREDVVCSPGTFVFWDWGYHELLPEQGFLYAAVLLTRVISVIDEKRICVDLGYKAVASENPLPRVMFLNAKGAKSLSQSEEHLVLEVGDSSQYPIGTELYAVPRHVCPTVALYDNVAVIEEEKQIGLWNVTARGRMLEF